MSTQSLSFQNLFFFFFFTSECHQTQKTPGKGKRNTFYIFPARAKHPSLETGSYFKVYAFPFGLESHDYN